MNGPSPCEVLGSTVAGVPPVRAPFPGGVPSPPAPLPQRGEGWTRFSASVRSPTATRFAYVMPKASRGRKALLAFCQARLSLARRSPGGDEGSPAPRDGHRTRTPALLRPDRGLGESPGRRRSTSSSRLRPPGKTTNDNCGANHRQCRQAPAASCSLGRTTRMHNPTPAYNKTSRKRDVMIDLR